MSQIGETTENVVVEVPTTQIEIGEILEMTKYFCEMPTARVIKPHLERLQSLEYF
jgi:hypothetical protein